MGCIAIATGKTQSLGAGNITLVKLGTAATAQYLTLVAMVTAVDAIVADLLEACCRGAEKNGLLLITVNRGDAAVAGFNVLEAALVEIDAR